jgi:hypothetical protein
VYFLLSLFFISLSIVRRNVRVSSTYSSIPSSTYVPGLLVSGIVLVLVNCTLLRVSENKGLQNLESSTYVDKRFYCNKNNSNTDVIGSIERKTGDWRNGFWFGVPAATALLSATRRHEYSVLEYILAYHTQANDYSY